MFLKDKLVDSMPKAESSMKLKESFRPVIFPFKKRLL
jgi:hypothetical protein